MRNRVLILGGGIAGLKLACVLSSQKDLSVSLVDREEDLAVDLFGVGEFGGRLYNRFSRAEIARKHGFDFLRGEISFVDQLARTCEVGAKKLGFDYLALALGGVWQDRRLLASTSMYYAWSREQLRLLAAALEGEVKLKQRQSSSSSSEIVVVGGGVVGVQAALNIKQFLTQKCSEANLDPKSFAVSIWERSGSLLHLNSHETGVVAGWLRQRGVEVRLHQHAEHSVIQAGQWPFALTRPRLLVWAGNPPEVDGGAQEDKLWWRRSQLTNMSFEVRGMDGVFALGEHARPPLPYRQLNLEAVLREVEFLATAVKAYQNNTSLPRFKPQEFPQFIFLGDNRYLKIFRGHLSVGRHFGFSARRAAGKITF